MVDNIYDFEGSLAQWGVLVGGDGIGGATFDLKAAFASVFQAWLFAACLLYTSPSPRDRSLS
eukprot:8915123-Pyramimonas_sp.AAC.1